MIKVENLNMAFGKKKVLENINFTVSKGEIFGFLGPSGAGKTTTIKILTNQLIPTSGKTKIDVKKEEIGILSDTNGAYERLTVYRNLRFFAELSNTPLKEVEKILKKVKLWDSKDQKVKNLSKGMKQRLLLACAVINNPKLLFLDEPTAALDPATVEEIHKLLFSLKENGTTIFLTTHNMEEADKMCDRIAFLNKGKIVEMDTPLKLKEKYSKPRILIKFSNKEVTIAKDTSKLIKVLEENKDNKIISIHSEEPNLAEIFLDLTGRELK